MIIITIIRITNDQHSGIFNMPYDLLLFSVIKMRNQFMYIVKTKSNYVSYLCNLY